MGKMGRKRIDPGEMLEERVYRKGKSFYYVHPDGKWEALGQNKVEANRKGHHYNDPDSQFGTMIYWLDQFIIDCERRVALNSTIKGIKLSRRTCDDYRAAVHGNSVKEGPLRTFFPSPLRPIDITPDMVQDFLTDSAEIGSAVQGNRHRACLSACFGWLLRSRHAPGLATNPCLRASGIQRNPEEKRERYVTHQEYAEVFAVATRSERLLMELTYRTLQRPQSDIILWTDSVIINEGGKRFLWFEQNKTRAKMKIAFTPALDELLPRREGKVLKLHAPLVSRLDGKHYTYQGLGSMLRRSIEVANMRREARRIPHMESFGFRDLKGKGATDMYYLAKVPIEDIQQLIGHASKSVTEIYIKQRWREAAAPNMVVMK